MPTFITFERKESFWKSINYLWKYGSFAGKFRGWKWEVSNLDDGLSFHLVFSKLKYLLTLNFRPKCSLSTRMRPDFQKLCFIPTFNTVEMQQIFENRLNTFGDMGFLLVQFTVWKWEISNLVDGLSFHLVIAKLKYSAPEIFCEMPTFNTFEMKQSFWKSG